MSVDISVIMPVYNAHEYLRESVDSVLNQTFKNFEFICVDDGSTDESLEILREYATRDNRVHVIHQENAGAGAARNKGLQYATGEYLSILDCDDFFEPEMLEKSFNSIKEHDSDIVVFGCDFYDNENENFYPCNYSINKKLLPVNNPFCADDVKKDVFKLFVGWSWDKLFRREFIEENNLLFQEQRTTNDMLFVFSAIIRAKSIFTISDIYAHHRRASGSLSVTRERSWKCFFDALLALRKQLKEWNVFERFERDFINYSLHFSLWNLNSLCEPTYSLLYDKLRNEWFEELGITKLPSSSFYNQYEYGQYRKICGLSDENKNIVSDNKSTIIKEKRRGNLFYRGWICLKDNGIRYTINNMLKKLKKYKK